MKILTKKMKKILQEISELKSATDLGFGSCYAMRFDENFNLVMRSASVFGGKFIYQNLCQQIKQLNMTSVYSKRRVLELGHNFITYIFKGLQDSDLCRHEIEEFLAESKSHYIMFKYKLDNNLIDLCFDKDGFSKFLETSKKSILIGIYEEEISYKIQRGQKFSWPRIMKGIKLEIDDYCGYRFFDECNKDEKFFDKVIKHCTFSPSIRKHRLERVYPANMINKLESLGMTFERSENYAKSKLTQIFGEIGS